MAQENFGSRLAEARRRQGLTLEQVHNQLRITPAILESLELGDFYHMPLKGHARNMVSAYARYLGLDSEELTKQFLREYHEFENRVSRREVSGGFPKIPSQGFESRTAASRAGREEQSAGLNSMWNKPIPSSELNRGYDSRSVSAQRVANASARRRGRSGGSSQVDSRYSSGSYTPRQSLPLRFFGTIFRNPIVLVVVLVIILIGLFVLWAMLANSCKNQENKIVPENKSSVVTQITPQDTLASPQTETDPRYGPFELAVEPVADTGPYTEVTVDGEVVFPEGALSEKKAWQVKESCSVSTAQPGNLTVTRNGEPVELTTDDNGFGTVELTVEKLPTDDEKAAGEEGTQDG